VLTISDIDRLCETQGSQLHKAVFPGLPAVRTLYISERVKQLITGTAPGMDIEMRGRWLTARAVLESFVDGKWITIKSKPKSRAEMTVLCPRGDGIWEIRDVKPKPSLRILGSFIQKDVFIALAPYERSELGAKDSEGWTNALQNYKVQWTELFDGHRPMSEGSYPDAYLSLARYLD
jgi:hypothetical protein